jgi:hyaluronate lyase
MLTQSSSALSRRSLLGALGGAALLSAAGLAAAPRAHAAPSAPTPSAPEGDIFEELRLRLLATLVGPPDLDLADPLIAQESRDLAARVDAILPLLDRSPDRAGVFTDNVLVDATDASVVTNTFKHLVDMAEAWATPGNAHSGSAALAEDIIAGLRTVHELQYAAGNAEWENWWDWEIGSPYRIGYILVMLHEVVPEDLRQAYVDAVAWYVEPGIMYPRDPARRKPASGSNLQTINFGAAILAILGRDEEILRGVQETSPLDLGFYDPETALTPNDGLYPDGSFLQHDKVAYNGSYGVSYIGGIADIVALLGGSPWEIRSDGMQEVLEGVDAGFLPVVFDGLLMDFVSGRDISYFDRSEASRGRGLVMTIIQLSHGAEPARRERWLGAAAGWIRRSAHVDLSRPTSITAVADLEAALAVAPLEEPSEAVVLPVMDRAVHRREGWAVSLTTASTRIARWEVTNWENRRPWHQGAGHLALYLTGDEEGQRSDGYWPTIDPFRLPGITVDSQQLETIETRTAAPAGFGRTVFTTVGGALEDGGRQRGRYGSAFQEEQSYGSTARVNQSWFFLDEGVVCLGAGIHGGTAAIETVLENHRVGSGSAQGWLVDGKRLGGSEAPGFTTTVRTPSSAVLEGVAGYVFLEKPAALHLLREDREGSWVDIRRDQSPPEPLTRSYQTAWIDHGAQPADATYAYLLVPRPASGALPARPGAGGVRVLANTAALQAIEVPRTRHLAAHFTGPGRLDARGQEIEADAPCGVSTLRTLGRGAAVEIAVADMERGTDALGVTLSLPVGGRWRIAHADASVEVVLGAGEVTLAITGDGTGNAHRVVLEG